MHALLRSNSFKLLGISIHLRNQTAPSGVPLAVPAIFQLLSSRSTSSPWGMFPSCIRHPEAGMAAKLDNGDNTELSPAESQVSGCRLCAFRGTRTRKLSKRTIAKENRLHVIVLR